MNKKDYYRRGRNFYFHPKTSIMVRGLINRLALNAGSPKPDIILHQSLGTMSPEEIELGQDCLLAVIFLDANVGEEIDLLVSKLEGLNFNLIS